MRFITKISILALATIAMVHADNAAEDKVILAGEEFQPIPTRRAAAARPPARRFDGDFGLGSWSDRSYSYDSEDYGRRHRCNKCGKRKPCGCKERRRPTSKSESSADLVEDPNMGQMNVTAPQFKNQDADACSYQSVSWSAPNLQAKGYTFLGYVVGGKECGKPIAPAEIIAENGGKLSTRNIFYLGYSNVDGGCFTWDIPYGVADGIYEPMVFAFKQVGKKIRYVLARGHNFKVKHNQCGLLSCGSQAERAKCK